MEMKNLMRSVDLEKLAKQRKTFSRTLMIIKIVNNLLSPRE
jgi:hypothetical protein